MADKAGVLNKLMTEYGGASNDEEEKEQAAATPATKPGIRDRKASIKGSDLGATVSPTAGKALMTAEERNSGSVEFRVYWEWIRMAGGWTFVLGMAFLLIATQATKIGTDIWLAQWSVNAYPNLTLTTYMVVYVVLGVIQGFAAVFIGLVLSYRGRQAAKRMHEKALEHVLHAPTSFFDQTPVGRIMNRWERWRRVGESND